MLKIVIRYEKFIKIFGNFSVAQNCGLNFNVLA